MCTDAESVLHLPGKYLNTSIRAIFVWTLRVCVITELEYTDDLYKIGFASIIIPGTIVEYTYFFLHLVFFNQVLY